ncbi:MAG: YicC family protein [Chitinophagales bacterium]|nr:YicC family protein [Chitinophagales bacterium]
MVCSMTGFASENLLLRDINYSLELKTLNSKGLDFIYKSPSLFRNLEIQVKNIIQKNLERGKVELSIQSKDGKKGFNAINEDVFTQQYDFLKNLSTKLGSSTEVFSLVVQNYNSLIEIEDLTEEEVNSLFSVIENLCTKVNHFRIEEGNVIKKDLTDWVNKIEATKNQVANLGDKRIESRREKLLQGIQEITTTNEIDYNRLGQEVIYYIEKLDISEELSRLQQHIQLFIQTVNSKEHAGKKLGFVAQEMGREINTIGSKANDSEIQHLVVDMKDLLERIKEQLNNVV